MTESASASAGSRRAGALLLCLLAGLPVGAGPARAAGVGDRAVSLAAAAVRQRGLLTPAELACSDFVFTGAEGGTASVTVAERHGGRCGGDPDTAPARFHMDIELSSGAVFWDNNDDLEMRPIP